MSKAKARDSVPEVRRPPSNLQSRILQDDEALRAKREQVRSEVLGKLPSLPHEVELKKELKDEEELLGLYKELEEKNNQAIQKRHEMTQKKINKLEEERLAHLARLQELESKPQVAWTKEKFDLIAEKRKLREAKQREKEMGLEQLRLQQELDLEKMFITKKELEAINQEKQALVQRNKAIYIQRDALDEELRAKDTKSKEFLDRVLQRGTQLEQKLLSDGALTNAEAAELLQGLVDQRLGGEFSKQALLDKLYEAKQREMKKVETLTKEKIKGLNQEKKKLMEIENKVLEEKGRHELLRQRGLDFLVEMEMGQGPDTEDLKKNLVVDPKAYRRYRTKEEILVSAKNIDQYGEQRVQQMREEYRKERMQLGQDQRSRESNAEFFARCSREGYDVARAMVQLVIEEAVFQINKKAEEFQEYLSKRPVLEGKKDKINKEIKEVRHRAAVVQIRNDILENVVAEMALETVKENMYLSKKIDEKMLDILVRALKLERNSATNQQDLQVLAQNLEDDKLVAAREAIMNLFEEKELKPDKLDANKTFEQKWWEINPDLQDQYADTEGKKDEKCQLI